MLKKPRTTQRPRNPQRRMPRVFLGVLRVRRSTSYSFTGSEGGRLKSVSAWTCKSARESGGEAAALGTTDPAGYHLPAARDDFSIQERARPAENVHSCTGINRAPRAACFDPCWWIRLRSCSACRGGRCITGFVKAGCKRSGRGAGRSGCCWNRSRRCCGRRWNAGRPSQGRVGRLFQGRVGRETRALKLET